MINYKSKTTYVLENYDLEFETENAAWQFCDDAEKEIESLEQTGREFGDVIVKYPALQDIYGENSEENITLDLMFHMLASFEPTYSPLVRMVVINQIIIERNRDAAIGVIAEIHEQNPDSITRAIEFYS